VTAMLLAAVASELLRALPDPWLAAEAAVPALAVLAGVAGAWLQAVHPLATAHEHDPVLVALLVV
jgi:hypothetical protein